MTTSSAEDYSRMRLREVTRIRNFLSWAERRHEIDEAPDKVRVSLTSEQAAAIIAVSSPSTRNETIRDFGPAMIECGNLPIKQARSGYGPRPLRGHGNRDDPVGRHDRAPILLALASTDRQERPNIRGFVYESRGFLAFQTNPEMVETASVGG
jgi:hypothetical protein